MPNYTHEGYIVGNCPISAVGLPYEEAPPMKYKATVKYDTHTEVHHGEFDPNGVDLKAGGAKADAGKVPVGRGGLHYFPRAITAVAELSAIGANKYSWKGWATVPDGIHRYGDALARHELKIEDDFSRRDPDTGVLEAVAVAWNALARLELILREQEKSK